jgi:membrane protease YdiL (CAAX protease family)
MNTDKTWECPSCGETNKEEILRCTCGHEVSLADSGEEEGNSFKYELTLTDDLGAFDYKSGKEIRDLFIITVLTFLFMFIVVGLFSMLFDNIFDEVGLALQSVIFSIAAVILNEKYPLNFHVDHFFKVAKYVLIGSVICLIMYWPYFMHLAEDKVAPEQYKVFAVLPSFRGYIFLLLAIIAVPLLEEILFRGFLFRLLIKKYGMFTAVVASSLIFAVYHGLEKASLIDMFLFSLVACYVYHKSQSIWASIVMHSINNAIWFWGTGNFLK